MYSSDPYKAYEDNVLVIDMSKALDSQTSLMSNGKFPSDPAQLLYYVALFYGKGEVSTANSLLKSLNS